MSRSVGLAGRFMITVILELEGQHNEPKSEVLLP